MIAALRLVRLHVLAFFGDFGAVVELGRRRHARELHEKYRAAAGR